MADRRVYDSRHLQADCQEPGLAPAPYARLPFSPETFRPRWGQLVNSLYVCDLTSFRGLLRSSRSHIAASFAAGGCTKEVIYSMLEAV